MTVTTECPNVDDKEIVWDWIKAHQVHINETYWIIRGMQEYEFIYKKNLIQEMIELGLIIEIGDPMYKSIQDRLLKKISTHFGQSYLNPATIAGLFRILIKQTIEKKYKGCT